MLMVSCGPIRNYDDPNEPFYEGFYAGEIQIPGEWIKIVTWNLNFAEGLGPEIDALRDVDELKGADILLLQEMDEVSVEKIAQELGYNFIYYPATIHRRHNKKFGNAILTKWKIREHEKILLPKSGSSRKHARNAVRANILIGDLEVSVVSVHLETFWIMQGKDQRQAAYLADQINRAGDIILLGGDFNSLTPWSITYLEDLFAQADLQRLSKNTGHTFVYHGIKLTLDHLFASGFNEFRSGVWRETSSSDHFPVWSQVRLQ